MSAPVRVVKKQPAPPVPVAKEAPPESERQERTSRRGGSGIMKAEATLEFWRAFFGKELVFQIKNGALISGTLAGMRQGFLVLENVAIKGRNNKAYPPTLMLDRQTVGWFHEPCEVEKTVT